MTHLHMEADRAAEILDTLQQDFADELIPGNILVERSLQLLGDSAPLFSNTVGIFLLHLDYIECSATDLYTKSLRTALLDGSKQICWNHLIMAMADLLKAAPQRPLPGTFDYESFKQEIADTVTTQQFSAEMQDFNTEQKDTSAVEQSASNVFVRRTRVDPFGYDGIGSGYSTTDDAYAQPADYIEVTPAQYAGQEREISENEGPLIQGFQLLESSDFSVQCNAVARHILRRAQPHSGSIHYANEILKHEEIRHMLKYRLEEDLTRYGRVLNHYFHLSQAAAHSVSEGEILATMLILRFHDVNGSSHPGPRHQYRYVVREFNVRDLTRAVFGALAKDYTSTLDELIDRAGT